MGAPMPVLYAFAQKKFVRGIACPDSVTSDTTQLPYKASRACA